MNKNPRQTDTDRSDLLARALELASELSGSRPAGRESDASGRSRDRRMVGPRAPRRGPRRPGACVRRLEDRQCSPSLSPSFDSSSSIRSASRLGTWCSGSPQAIAQLGHGVGEDLREAVVGLDVAELLVGRPLAIGCLPRRLTGALAGLLAFARRLRRALSSHSLGRELALHRGEPRVDARVGIGGGCPRALARTPDLGVGLLHLLEQPC